MACILTERPGLFFVIATLMPLVSFVLLLLAGALRWFVRMMNAGDDKPPEIHHQTKIPAYVATGAMVAAFVLSVIGTCYFLGDHHGSHAEEHKKAADPHPGEGAKHAAKEDAKIDADPWAGFYQWAVLSGKESQPATVLELGYKIDSLTVVMFLMVTLIGSLIHLFSIGYMGEELAPVVEDHHVHTEAGHLRRRGRFGRFFLFLSLFCFSMLNLILADNLFQVFLSWELVGICSYLLIGFYHERQSASNAANKAFITNRIGDAGFIIGLLIIWTYIGTFNFEGIFKKVRAPARDAHATMDVYGQIVRGEPIAVDPDKMTPGLSRLKVTQTGSEVLLFPAEQSLDEDDEEGHFHGVKIGSRPWVQDNPEPREYSSMPYWLLVVAGLGIFLGCVGKSAQFPLHVWLPDAMEGPTPVSALIHAATMVAAGVYLVGRVYPLFTPEARLVIAYTGGITLFVAATIAVVMTDIKKVLAYSTVSQLGYMMLALGVGGWVAGLFHLVTHAFFKALLFLGSGSVIYGCHHEQEMTKMGGLYPKMKITAITMLIGVLTIAGIPLFSGWYSKDAILAHALGFARVHPEHALLFLLPLITAGITTFYMFRMWFMTFAGQPRDHHVHDHAHESPWPMTVPLIVLAFFSIVVAWGWPIWDAEASHLEKHIHHSQHHAVLAEFGYLVEYGDVWQGGAPPRDVNETERFFAAKYHHLAGNLALGVVALGIIFASLLYYYRVLDPAEAKEQFPGVHRFLTHKWYFDELYSAILVRPALVVAHWCRKFDNKVIDGIADGTARNTVRVARWDGRFDLGIIDGMVNLTARVVFGVGAWFRNIQTGFIRSYVLFLVLAAVSIFAILALAFSGKAE